MRGSAFYAQKAGRRDANHSSVRDGLEALAYLVADLGGAGGGISDLAVRDRRWPPDLWKWIEVKTEDGDLTSAQLKLHAKWLAFGVKVHVVRNLNEALVVLRG